MRAVAELTALELAQLAGGEEDEACVVARAADETERLHAGGLAMEEREVGDDGVPRRALDLRRCIAKTRRALDREAGGREVVPERVQGRFMVVYDQQAFVHAAP